MQHATPAAGAVLRASLHRPKSREEWLALRKGRMTSSVVAAALGLDPHATPLDAWLSITGRSTFDGNKATIRGTRLESPVLDYPTRGGHLVRKEAPFALGVDGWSADSTDCLYVSRDGAVHCGEAKTVAGVAAAAWGDEGTDEIPERVLVQNAWHMAHWPEAVDTITPVLFGGFTFEFREYVVMRDDDLIGQVIDAARRFYVDHVLTDMPPPASAGDSAGLSFLWPRHTPEKYLPDSARAAELARAYVAAREDAKEAEGRKEALSAEIRMMLADAEGVRGPGYKATYKHQGGQPATDWEALARTLGATEEQIKNYTRESAGYRVLRVTLPEEKPEKTKSKRKKVHEDAQAPD